MGKILGGYLFPHPPIIIHEIGQGEEIKATKTIEGVKYLAKDIKNKAPKTIVVITPHGPLFTDAISISIEKELKGDFLKFGNYELKFKVENNLELAYKIIRNALKENIMMAQVNEELAKDYNIELNLDHGTLVPLYFVDKEYKDFKLIHITYGLLSPRDLYRFGKCIKDAIGEVDDDVVIIASGDLSHKLSDEGPYTYSPYGKEYDNKIIEVLRSGDMEKIVNFDLGLAERARECGLRSMMIMAGTLDKANLKTEVLSYEGPFGVGYGTAKVDIIGYNDEDILDKIKAEEKRKITAIREKEDQFVRLARSSLEYYLKNERYMNMPENLGEELLNERKAVFVTLKKNGMLRGCIGSTEPREKNIATEIIKYAVYAGTRDPRFERVDLNELEELVYSVDVLSEPEPINNKNELDAERYGVIVTKGTRSGLLLPNIEGVDSVDEQVRIALGKAGIRDNESYSMERFEVIRHH